MVVSAERAVELNADGWETTFQITAEANAGAEAEAMERIRNTVNEVGPVLDGLSIKYEVGPTSRLPVYPTIGFQDVYDNENDRRVIFLDQVIASREFRSPIAYEYRTEIKAHRRVPGIAGNKAHQDDSSRIEATYDSLVRMPLIKRLRDTPICSEDSRVAAVAQLTNEVLKDLRMKALQVADDATIEPHQVEIDTAGDCSDAGVGYGGAFHRYVVTVKGTYSVPTPCTPTKSPPVDSLSKGHSKQDRGEEKGCRMAPGFDGCE